MVSGLYWSRGIRARNEDSIAYESVRSDRGDATLMVVADGIGSLSSCEIASGYIVECFIKWFYKYGIRMGKRSQRRIARSLRKCAYDCCSELRTVGRLNGINWGSTLSLVCIWKRRYVAVHLGDSPIVMIRRGQMHSLFPPDRNEKGMLTKAMGTMRYDAPDICFGRLRRGEGLLVASDGFLDKMKPCEIVSGLTLPGEITEERITTMLAKLGKESERRGGADNRSAIYIVG